ncbi:hypothetical protein N5U22_10305 [Aliarcobacter cryaerophilus]|uniref:Qat anti-phage system associated protein QatB n=1 Tax=Aliarcobacter cryaerophilus TaxID=28198 RepID=UPI0021B4F6CE|nr:Qat anti-phage system associated protein QatB [Aliarcobacter cryaerophilus]MCT7533806.1 hypothetical protein [Aliarcobacter cryaerophilus]
MGTSTSSSGPASGISMDPPWIDDIISGINVTTDLCSSSEQENKIPIEQASTESSIVLAPIARFGTARKNLSKFAISGSHDSFKKAVGHYSKKGMGGASNVAKRMRASTNSISGLVSFLRDIKNNILPDVKDWVQNLLSKSPSANDVIDAIIDRVTNEGGIIDEESIKNSMAHAMSDLLEQNPNIELLNLGDDESWDLIEGFLAYEASNRLQLDIGQLLERKLTPPEMVQRVDEMRDYLKSEISAQLQQYKSSDKHPDISKLNAVIHLALENTFVVFEGEV